MNYLNYEGLKYYHSLLKEKLKTLQKDIVKAVSYKAGDNITIEDNVISAEIPEYQAGDNIDITDGVISAVIPEQESEHAIAYASTAKQQYNDDKIYFTTDTREIYRNGISYGGTIGAEAVSVLPTGLSNKVLKDTAANTKFYPVTHVDAVVGLNTALAEGYVTLEMRDADLEAYEQDCVVVAGALNQLDSRTKVCEQMQIEIQNSINSILAQQDELVISVSNLNTQVVNINNLLNWQDE